MNKRYARIVNGKLEYARPQRIDNPDGSGYSVRYISPEDEATGEYKEVLMRGNVPPNADALVRAGRLELAYEVLDNYIVVSVKAK